MVVILSIHYTMGKQYDEIKQFYISPSQIRQIKGKTRNLTSGNFHDQADIK